MMHLKMLVTDMDGTFLREDKSYDEKRFEKILIELEKRGIIFVVASGNQIFRLKEYFQNFSNRIIYIAENGAQVWIDNEMLFSEKLARELVLNVSCAILEHPKMEGRKVLLSGEKGAYLLNSADEAYKKKMSRFYRQINYVEDFSKVDDEIVKITMNLQNENLGEVEKFLNTIQGVRATTSGFQSIDVIKSGISKASRIKFLEDYFKISSKEIAAFGDNLNDKEMLMRVAYPFATENAVNAIKEIAREVTPSCEEQGVLTKIEELLKSNI
ncbi:MAG: Cof-type HAD-IIB family hydrolase [Streptococcaceae bacterium]|jgi:Cof subfamily protein (haloacid dehalogenase superfamily)|nr:Cof-type HAD-IIB family hydrolase [Streptococcaceae bacterium]